MTGPLPSAESSGPVSVVLLTSAPGWRGSGASFAKIARGLERGGHSPLVLTAAAEVTARMRAEGLPVRELSLPDTGPQEAWALRRVLRERGARVMVVDRPRDLRLGAWAGVGLGLRIVYRYNLHNRVPRSDLADRLYYRRVDDTVFQSRFIQEAALAAAPWLARRPCHQIPNGYDTARLSPDPVAGRAFRAGLGLPPEARVLLTGAMLAANTGHETAFRAVARLRERGLDPVLVVCGRGERADELRALAERLELRATFTGLLEPPAMRSALCAADVVLHPAARDIFPNVVGEAMACGCAVVGAEGGGVPELLGRDGSAGILVPPDDPVAMADAAALLLADPDRRAALGAAARRRIEGEFSLSRMEAEYVALLAGPAGRPST